MKLVPMIFHLTVHSLSFHIKFPATIFLQLQIGKQRREIIQNIQLSNKVLHVNRQIRQQFQMPYVNGRFQQKQINIVIFLTTKTNPNKLTAGILSIPLTQPNHTITHHTATPSRCNDQNAYIQYSLRTELDLSPARSSRLMRSQGVARETGRDRSQPSRFNSAVLYNNNEINNMEEDQYQNELHKYLKDSQVSNNNAEGSRRRYQSSNKYINHQSSIDDDSKTQRRSYALNHSNQIAGSRHSQEMVVDQLRRQGDQLKGEVTAARGQAQRWLKENKELKGRVKLLEGELEQQNTAVKNMQKRIEMKEGSAGEEGKQLRNKLQQTEAQVHDLMRKKVALLGNLQNKEKEWLTVGKEKQKISNDERKRLASELQLKQSNLNASVREAGRLRQQLTISESIVLQLNQTKTKLQEKIQNYDIQINRYRIELSKTKQDINQLQETLKSKEETGADVKALKKTAMELQRQKDDMQLRVKQKDIEMEQIRLQIQSLKTQLRGMKENAALLSKQLQQTNRLFETLQVRQRKLQNEINRYQTGINKQQSQSDKIGKHVKQIELQLNKIKLESDYSNASKTKKISEYERINELLNTKIQLLAQQNFSLSANLMQLTDKYKLKQDEHFYLGQQLIVAKQSLITLQAQTEALRQDNQYLLKQTRLLDLRQDELSRLQQKLQHNEKTLEELEQSYQLREIELNNQIKLMTARKEEREEQVKELKEHIGKLEREGLELQGETENLTYSLKNKESQLESLRSELERERRANLQFEERMVILRRTQDTSLSSLQELRQENISFKQMICENEQAIGALGRRYEGLYKSIMESLQWLFEMLKQRKKLTNQSIRNERVQISSILNDCIREMAEERRVREEELEGVQKQLREQRDRNRQSQKLLKIKGQIQEELESEISTLKANQDIQQVKLTNCENQILNYQTQVREKTNSIRELGLSLENNRKEAREDVANLYKIIAAKQVDIEHLREQLACECERWRTEQSNLRKKIQNIQLQSANKLTAVSTKCTQLQSNWRTERDVVRVQRLKITELENTIARQLKQREVLQLEMESRAKELINTKVESNFKSKVIAEKQAEVNEQRRTIDRLERQKEGLQNRRKGLEEGNKVLVIARSQLEETLRQRSSEITTNKMQINVLQESTAKMIRQKEELLKQKKAQVQNTAKLNETIKTLKEGSIRSDDAINRLTLDKESLEKEFSKRINVLTNEKEGLQRQLKDLRTKQGQSESQQAEKYAAIANELKETQAINEEYAKTVAILRAEATGYISKLNNLNGSKIDTGKLQQFLDFVDDLKILGGNSQKNRLKLKKISSNEKLQKLPSLLLLSDVNREIIVSLNRLKIKILNRSDISQQNKAFVLQDIKGVQLVVEKLAKCAAQ